MALVASNGIRLAYRESGTGEKVLLIQGSGAAARVWDLYQTPALHAAGFATVVFDNRGVPPSDAPAGKYSLDDMVADTAGLIEGLGLGPCRIVGLSVGALVAQELLINRPHLVRSAVLMATCGRTSTMQRAQYLADIALLEDGVRLPPAYEAYVSALQMLSMTTLRDPEAAATWLDMFEMTQDADQIASGQLWVETPEDRRTALAKVPVPCRVIAFSHDAVTPPELGREVAEAIPDCDYVEVSDCGHLGHLERPEAVNKAVTEFLLEH